MAARRFMLPQCFLTSGMTIAISAMKARKLIDVSSHCTTSDLRTSIMAFFNYFEGVLNRWIGKLDSSFKVDEEPIGRKIEYIRSRIRGGRRLPQLDWHVSRSLRNKICHLKLTDNDLIIVEELLNGRFFSDANHIVNWLSIASKRLGMDCHPNAPNVLRQWAGRIGTPVANRGG